MHGEGVAEGVAAREAGVPHGARQVARQKASDAHARLVGGPGGGRVRRGRRAGVAEHAHVQEQDVPLCEAGTQEVPSQRDAAHCALVLQQALALARARWVGPRGVSRRWQCYTHDERMARVPARCPAAEACLAAGPMGEVPVPCAVHQVSRVAASSCSSLNGAHADGCGNKEEAGGGHSRGQEGAGSRH